MLRPFILALSTTLSAATCGAGAEFTVFAPGQQPDTITALSRILSPNSPADVRVEDTLEAAVQDRSDVLVLFMKRESERAFSPEMIAALQTRRVIGIGYGSAQVFGELRLEINGEACAHNTLNHVPEIRIEENKLCPQLKGNQFVVFRFPDSDGVEDLKRTDDNFAMHLPPGHEASRFVEAIARRAGDENYAPVVKQGNHILIGLAAPPHLWTEEYRTFFSAVAQSLLKAQVMPFVRASWEPTKPGLYDFELAEGRSTTQPSGREFHFQFTEPVQLTASLEYSGNANLMLLFMGENREHWTRVDAKSGEKLEVKVNVTSGDIAQMGDGYWLLKVTNFSKDKRSACRLSIEY